MFTTANRFGFSKAPGLMSRFGLPMMAHDTPGEAGGDKGGAKPPETKPKAITFESQDELDEFMEGRLGRERKKYQRQLDDLNRRLDEAEKKGAKQGDNGEKLYTRAEVEELIAKEHAPKLQAAEEKATKLLAQAKENAILKASGGAHDAARGHLVKLLSDDIGFDDEDNLVVLENGKVKLGNGGKPISVEQHVEAFLAANSHLAKASGTNGVGSQNRNAAGTTGQKPEIKSVADAENALVGYFRTGKLS